MDFERREALSAPYVRYLVKKVKETGILSDKKKRAYIISFILPPNEYDFVYA